MSCYDTGSTTACSTPSSSDTTANAYTYSADNLRMTSKEWNSGTSSVTTTNYTWDATTSALLSDGSDDYVYGTNGNVPIAQIATSGSITDELLTDTNSNVRGVVEISSGATSPDQLVNYVDYDAWGKPISYPGGTVVVKGLLTQSGTDTNSLTRFGYGGSYQDDTGLYFLVNRYYDQGTGQFISVDPDFTGTGEAYVYAGDNPVMAVDYLGLCGGIFCAIASVVSSGVNDVGHAITSAASATYSFARCAAHMTIHYLDNVRHAVASGAHLMSYYLVKHWKQIAIVGALIVVGVATDGAGDVAILDVAGEELAFTGSTESAVVGEAAESVGQVDSEIEASSTARAREIGRLGEERSGIDQSAKIRIPSASRTAVYRIPDDLTSSTLMEIKNVAYQSLTAQLRDFLSYAAATGRDFIFVTRESTKLSGPLQDLVNSGRIILERTL